MQFFKQVLHTIQFGPEGKNTRNPYYNPTPEVTDKHFIEWVEKGKPEDQFDHAEMGLDMMTIPTKFFGWEGITETMKKVFSLCSHSISLNTNCFHARHLIWK
jgi:hypothetical protein